MSNLLPFGIHFGLKDEDYFADPGLGSNSVKSIAFDACEYQFDVIYGEDKDTAALQWGHAIHKRVLEGKKAFEDTYIIKPDPTDYPGLLTTNKELKEHAQSLGLNLSGKNRKDDFIKAIRQFDGVTPIWEVIMNDFDSRIENGHRTLEPKIRGQVEFAAQWMQMDRVVGAAMENTQFVGGAPEVSMIWDRNGVRCKSRLDYLIPNSIIDLKSFSPARNISLVKGVGNAIGNFWYDMQAVHYEDGWQSCREHFHKGNVFGEQPWPTFLDEVYDRPRPEWVWVFIKRTGAPQTMTWLFPQETELWKTAALERQNGLEEYAAKREKFGLEKPWPPEHEVYEVYDGLVPTWSRR